MNQARVYVAVTEPGCEKRAMRWLIENDVAAFTPMRRFWRYAAGRRHPHERPVPGFERYVFVASDLAPRAVLGAVSACRYVSGMLGGGDDPDRAPGSREGFAAPAAPSSVVSRGLVRSKADKLMLVPNRAGDAVHVGGSAAHGGFVQGATALKGELAERMAPVTASSLAPQVETVAEKRAEARMKGYVGESCPECGNFTMVRNGTCLKCDTCGGTTGCS